MILVTITEKIVTEETFLLDESDFDSWDFKDKKYLNSKNVIEKDDYELTDNVIEQETIIRYSTSKEQINESD